jgi:hypothetical protein
VGEIVVGNGIGVGAGGVQEGPGWVALAHCALSTGKKNIVAVQSVSANSSAPALTPKSKG